MTQAELGQYLESLVDRYNRPSFVPPDPISIPHRFSKKQDIEIAGLFAALLAWGLRKTILNKCEELMGLMDWAPHDFVLHHSEEDLKALLHFKHRTFQATDLLYFVDFLHRHYKAHDSLESAFVPGEAFESVEACLTQFRDYFVSGACFPKRTGKHVATPARNSACKRLNMYLRWMVRRDDAGVDFGLWQRIPMSELVCPCDVHVLRVAYGLGLLEEKEEKSTWQTAQKLTRKLKVFAPDDPVRYDFALFNLGIDTKF